MTQSDAQSWQENGSTHDFGDPDADGIRIEAYQNGFLDITCHDGPLSDDDQATYTLDVLDCKILVAILIDHLTRIDPFSQHGCPLAGTTLPNRAQCPFCASSHGPGGEA